jgi:hypothetical protein
VPLFWNWGTHESFFKPLIIVVPYAMFVMGIFLYPVFASHFKLVSAKRSLARPLLSEIETYFPTPETQADIAVLLNYFWRREFLVDGQRMRDWPLDLGNIVKGLAAPVASIILVLARYYQYI